MISHYSIKFGPAVSQKDLHKALHESGDTPLHSQFNKLKARIEVIGEFADLKKATDLLKETFKAMNMPHISQSAIATYKGLPKTPRRSPRRNPGRDFRKR